jgi:hypothetical protein
VSSGSVPPSDDGRSVATHALRVVLAAGALLSAHATYTALEHASYLGEHLGGAAALAAPLLGGSALIALAAVVELLRRPLAEPSAALRLCAAFTALAWIGVLVWEQPPRPLVLEFLASGVAAALGSVVLLASRGVVPAAWTGSSRWPRLLLKTCGSLLLLELLLRGVDFVYPHPLLVRESTSVQQNLRAQRPPPGARHHGFECNSYGHYDVEIAPPPRDRPLVVCIGDSFSAGVVPHRLHYTTVAEDVLDGPEIYNMGLPATDVPEYLWLLEHEALPLRPELLVIALFVGNDIAPARAPQTSWTVQLFERENMLSWVLPRRLWTLRREGLLGANLQGHADAEGEARRARREPLLTSLDEISAALPWTFQPQLEPPSFTPAAFLEIELDRAYWIGSPDTHDYEQLYVWLAELVRVAGETPLCFLILPDEFQVEDAVWNDVLAHPRGAPLDRDQPQRLLGAWFEQQQLAYCDPLPDLRAADALHDGRKHLYHMRDTHLNARGNRIVGQSLARFLEPRLRALRPWSLGAAR